MEQVLRPDTFARPTGVSVDPVTLHSLGDLAFGVALSIRYLHVEQPGETPRLLLTAADARTLAQALLEKADETEANQGRAGRSAH